MLLVLVAHRPRRRPTQCRTAPCHRSDTPARPAAQAAGRQGSGRQPVQLAAPSVASASATRPPTSRTPAEATACADAPLIGLPQKARLPASRPALGQRPERRVTRLAASASVSGLGVVRDDVLHEQFDSILTGGHAVAEQAEKLRAAVPLGGHLVGKTVRHLCGASCRDQFQFHSSADRRRRGPQLLEHQRRLTPTRSLTTVENGTYPSRVAQADSASLSRLRPRAGRTAPRRRPRAPAQRPRSTSPSVCRAAVSLRHPARGVGRSRTSGRSRHHSGTTLR